MDNSLVDQIIESILNSEVFYVIASAIASYFIISLKKVRTKLLRSVRALKDKINEPHIMTEDNTNRIFSIDKEMLHIKIKTDAVRTLLLQFHNGEMFNLNNPMFKFTCTHEHVKRGYSTTGDEMKNVPMSRMLDLLRPLLKGSKEELAEGVTIISPEDQDGSELNNPPMFRFVMPEMEYSKFVQYAEKYGIQKLYGCLLRSPSKKGASLGILLLQLDVNDKKAEQKFIDMLDYINEHIGQLEYLLD